MTSLCTLHVASDYIIPTKPMIKYIQVWVRGALILYSIRPVVFKKTLFELIGRDDFTYKIYINTQVPLFVKCLLNTKTSFVVWYILYFETKNVLCHVLNKSSISSYLYLYVLYFRISHIFRAFEIQISVGIIVEYSKLTAFCWALGNDTVILCARILFRWQIRGYKYNDRYSKKSKMSFSV